MLRIEQGPDLLRRVSEPFLALGRKKTNVLNLYFYVYLSA
jgi:hypothetical protein